MGIYMDNNNHLNNSGAGNVGNSAENVSFFLHKCSNCGAPLKVEYGITSVTCEYCGYTSLISPSELEQMESKKLQGAAVVRVMSFY